MIPHAIDGSILDPGKDDEGNDADPRDLREILVLALSNGPTAGFFPTGEPKPVSSAELVKRAILATAIQEAGEVYKLTKENLQLVEDSISALWQPGTAVPILAALHGLQESDDDDAADED